MERVAQPGTSELAREGNKALGKGGRVGISIRSDIRGRTDTLARKIVFTIILRDQAGRELARRAREGNERYLVRDQKEFPILSELDMFSYDVFSQADAAQLHGELLALHRGLDEGADRDHVKDLIELAFRAANTEGATLVFTPFP